MASLYKPLLYCLLPALMSFPAHAQKEGNIWYFGSGAGISFNTSPPSVLTNGRTSSREGVATISDKNTGKLLFYTEGTTIWDAGQEVMPHGSGLQGDYSSTQSAIIVPDPGNPDKYYIFTTALSKGLRYSEVDMTLNGGKGDVIPGTKNTLLIPNDKSTEKLIATRHCNGRDYWVITHTLGDNDYYVYPVTPAGIRDPLIFKAGSVIHRGGAEVTSYLKISPDGNLLANAFGLPAGSSTSKVELLHFNNSTGVISGPVTVLNDLDYPYGAEFSPNGNLLYVSTQRGSYIYQYNLQSADINASRVTINTSGNLKYGALQSGPDGKIYVSAENGYKVGYGYLGIINNPDIAGTGCNYRPDAFYLGGKLSLTGLPTFVGSFFYDPLNFRVSGTCLGSATTFKISNTKDIDSVTWDFGDNSVSNALNPAHHYRSAKQYKVRLIIFYPCKIDTAYKKITINKPYAVTIDTFICREKPYTLPDGSKVTDAGTYSVKLASSSGCDSTVITRLIVAPPYHLTDHDTICSGEKYTLPNGQITDTAGIFVSHLHTSRGRDSIITTILSYRRKLYIQYQDSICEGSSITLPDGKIVSQPGTFRMVLPAATGCDTLAIFNISVKYRPDIKLGSDTCLVAGQSVLLDPGGGYPRYEWQNGATGTTQKVSFPGLYWVKVSNECGTTTDSINVTTDCLPAVFIPSAFTPNGDGMNDVFHILNIRGQKLVTFNVYDRWGSMVFHTTDISKGWNGKLRGRPQSIGSYVYLIKLIDLSGKPQTYKGTVLLIR